METLSDRIVVGLDETETARTAVTYAADLAAATGRGLTIVHAHQPPPHAYTPAVVNGRMLVDDVRGVGTELLEAVAETTRVEHPDLDVDEQLLAGSAAVALAAASEEAHAVVVGSRGAGQVKAVVLGSTSDQLLSNARGPVYVVPAGAQPSMTTPEDISFHQDPRPVVLVTDGQPASGEAARLAFETAHREARPLMALMLRRPGPAGRGRVPSYFPEELVLAELEDQLERSLELVREDYPDVQVEERVVKGDPVDAIATESTRASLVVLGSRGQGYVKGLLMGSTSRQALRGISGPVLVARVPALQAG